MGATLQVPAQTLMVGDKVVATSLAEHRIDVIERAGGVTRVEAMGQSKVYADADKVLIALVDGKPPPRQLAARVLGGAVHPLAVNRLFEVWPEAQVEVRHDRTWRGILFTGKRVQLRRTVVEVWEGEKNPIPLPQGQAANHRHVTREAVCHPDDTFRKADGVRLAFDRCLREAVRRSDPARVGGFGRSR